MSENFIKEEKGEFFIDTAAENLVISLFQIGQALTKITDGDSG